MSNDGTTTHAAGSSALEKTVSKPIFLSLRFSKGPLFNSGSEGRVTYVSPDQNGKVLKLDEVRSNIQEKKKKSQKKISKKFRAP